MVAKKPVTPQQTPSFAQQHFFAAFERADKRASSLVFERYSAKEKNNRFEFSEIIVGRLGTNVGVLSRREPNLAIGRRSEDGNRAIVKWEGLAVKFII